MSTPLVALPEIRRLSGKDAPTLPPRASIVPLSDLLIGAYNLPRGSVFYADPDVTEPYLFAAQVPTQTHEGRAYVVVAREIGDLGWPAFLQQQRRMVHGDVTRLVAEVLGDVKKQLGTHRPYARRFW